ncbi:MAG: hypothetical protein V4577_23960 [Bacteroidota bacterium]
MKNIPPVQDNYLQFTVIAAFVTTLGALLAMFIKEFLLVKYFDNVREKKALQLVSKKYKDPILLSAVELARRLRELNAPHLPLSGTYTISFLFDQSTAMKKNDATDPYFLKYKIVSTIYRFCAFFGWLELFRQDITFLNSHSKKESQEFSRILRIINSSIADGQINNEPDWETWKDVLIFREELRAIGEGMIEIQGNQKTIFGYGKFKEIMSSAESVNNYPWLNPVTSFFTEFNKTKDFRIQRLDLLLKSLKELIKCLDKDYYEKHLTDL